MVKRETINCKICHSFLHSTKQHNKIKKVFKRAKKHVGEKRMSNSFEEFLKECLEDAYSGDVDVVEDVFKALGEWAIEYYIIESGVYEDNILLDIANACLGEKTVRVYLKEQSKKRAGEEK